MNAEPVRIASRRRRCRGLVFLLMACTIVGLTALNVMTLASASWHDTAYGHLSAALNSALLQEVTAGRSAGWLKGSKTESVHTEIGRQTRQLRQAYADMASKAAAARIAIEVADRTIAFLKKENADIGRDRDDYKVRHAKVRQDHDSFKAKAGKLAEIHAKRAARGVSRRIAGAAGQAIPFAGATVTAALLAIDVQDACQSVKDLESLSGAEAGVRSWIAEACRSTPTAADLVYQVKKGWAQAYATAVTHIPDRPKLSVPEKTITEILNSVPW